MLMMPSLSPIESSGVYNRKINMSCYLLYLLMPDAITLLFRFGPYFCQPVIAGLGDEDKPFICTMDSIGAK